MPGRRRPDWDAARDVREGFEDDAAPQQGPEEEDDAAAIGPEATPTED